MKNDMYEKLMEHLDSMTPEEKRASMMQTLYDMHGGKEGYEWAKERERQRIEDEAPDEVPPQAVEVLADYTKAKAAFDKAKAELEGARLDIQDYCMAVTGLKLHQGLTVQTGIDIETDEPKTDWGYISRFELLENGTVLFHVRFQFGSGRFGLSDIVEKHEVVEPL